MRGMIKRTLVAGVAVLGLGAVSAPAGGFVSGHWNFSHGGSQGFGAQPLVRPGQMPPAVVNPRPATVSRLSASEFGRRHRRVFGFDVPVAGIGMYGPLTEPGYVGTIDPPLPPPLFEDNAPRYGRPVASVCQTETRTVPSETGGAHTIHITRCWN